jgi:outer membrane protein
MNIPYSPNLEVQPLGDALIPTAYNATIDQIYQNATRNLAQVKAAQLHLASASKGVQATRGAMMPTLSLIGQVYTNYSSAAATQNPIGNFNDSTGAYALNNLGAKLPVYSPQTLYQSQNIAFGDQFKNNVNTQIGLSLNIPILNGLRSRTQYRLAQVALEQAKYNANTTIVQLRQSIESYYVMMMSGFRTYNTLAQQVQDYEESYRSATIRYDAGALKSLDFIISTGQGSTSSRLNTIISSKPKYSTIFREH